MKENRRKQCLVRGQAGADAAEITRTDEIWRDNRRRLLRLCVVAETRISCLSLLNALVRNGMRDRGVVFTDDDWRCAAGAHQPDEPSPSSSTKVFCRAFCSRGEGKKGRLQAPSPRQPSSLSTPATFIVFLTCASGRGQSCSLPRLPLYLRHRVSVRLACPPSCADGALSRLPCAGEKR